MHETKNILKKALRYAEREKKWVMLESVFIERLKQSVEQRNGNRTRHYAEFCSRTVRREYRFEKKVIGLLEKLRELNPEWDAFLSKLEEQIRVYENNIISKLSNPWFGEKGTIQKLLEKEPLNWEQIETEVNSAYSQGVQQLIILLDNIETKFTKYLEDEERYLYMKPGKKIKGDYIRLSELIAKGNLVSNKINVEIRGNKIFRDNRDVQGCDLAGDDIIFLGYHFTNKKAADLIESDMKIEIGKADDPYVCLLEPMSYSGLSNTEMKYLTGSSAATDFILVKVKYPVRKVWLKFEKNRPTHFATEGDITFANLLKRKGVYLLRGQTKNL